MHLWARLDLRRREWERAAARNSTGRQFAHTAGFHALDFEIHVLDVRAASGRGDRSLAFDTLELLRTPDQPDHELAALLYERWLITGEEQDRIDAAHAYGTRHDLAPSAHTARRLGRLTGEAVALSDVSEAAGDPPPPEAFSKFLA